MAKPIKERSYFLSCFLGALTCCIYPIIFWHKLSKDVNKVCEGDGAKTMPYVYSWLLNIVTVGIFGFIWKFLLAERLRRNAARYGLRISDSGLAILLISLLVPIAGVFIAKIILVKNFNKLAAAYNEYNGLAEEEEFSFFAD
jgi:hypothetical protein